MSNTALKASNKRVGLCDETLRRCLAPHNVRAFVHRNHGIMLKDSELQAYTEHLWNEVTKEVT